MPFFDPSALPGDDPRGTDFSVPPDVSAPIRLFDASGLPGDNPAAPAVITTSPDGKTQTVTYIDTDYTSADTFTGMTCILREFKGKLIPVPVAVTFTSLGAVLTAQGIPNPLPAPFTAPNAVAWFLGTVNGETYDVVVPIFLSESGADIDPTALRADYEAKPVFDPGLVSIPTLLYWDVSSVLLDSAGNTTNRSAACSLQSVYLAPASDFTMEGQAGGPGSASYPELRQLNPLIPSQKPRILRISPSPGFVHQDLSPEL